MTFGDIYTWFVVGFMLIVTVGAIILVVVMDRYDDE